MHFYKKTDAKELHFGILNLVLKVIYDGCHYCFCNEYAGCEKENGERVYGPICKIAYDFGDIEKRCNFAQFDFHALCKIAKELFPYLDECFEVKYSDDLLELVNHGQFYYSHRGNYAGVKNEASLREMIKMTTDLKIRNGEKNILSFFFNSLLADCYFSYI